MIISSDEAMARAREFAKEIGMLTSSEEMGVERRLLWRVHFDGEYQDFEIYVDAETGEIACWHCQSPLQIGMKKAAERAIRERKRGTPLGTKDLTSAT